MYYVCDIGGTNMRIAPTDGHSFLLEPVIRNTPQSYDEILHLLKSEISSFQQQISGVNEGLVLGVPGILQRDKKTVFRSPHVPALNGMPMRDDVAQILGVPVFMENDTALVGLGEAVNGAGAAFRIVAYVTLSSGVGGVRIVNKRIDQHAFGFEPGHHFLRLTAHEHCAGCKISGHWEAFVGGKSIALRNHQTVQNHFTNEQKQEIAWYTAVGLYNTLMYWSPDVVVLGGGMVVHDVVEIDTVKIYLQEIGEMLPEVPPIVKSMHNHVGGLWGGLAYLNDHIQHG